VSSIVISVVIPAHNAGRTLADCLQAIGHSTYRDYEVIVVDDASTDDTRQIALQYGCKVSSLQKNVGAARAKNIGAAEATGEIVLFTDADIVLMPDTMDLVAANLSDQTISGVVGLLGRKLRYGNFGSQFKNLWMHHTYARLARRADAERGVGLFYTSIAAIRRAVFEQMGGFDPQYRGSSVTEDIEFGQRLLTAGHIVRLDGRLQVEHLKHYSLAGVLKTDLQRAFGLTKTWLRKKLEPAQRAAGQKYYASVPWSFILSVPLAWLLPLLVLLLLWTGDKVWALLMLAGYAGIVLLNGSFLRTLCQARGAAFVVQSSLFLPIDLWVSGLGALWAILDYLCGKRY
jgi:glycosyltransferase involved in cell wall biosynthesis